MDIFNFVSSDITRLKLRSNFLVSALCLNPFPCGKSLKGFLKGNPLRGLEDFAILKIFYSGFKL